MPDGRSIMVLVAGASRSDRSIPFDEMHPRRGPCPGESIRETAHNPENEGLSAAQDIGLAQDEVRLYP